MSLNDIYYKKYMQYKKKYLDTKTSYDSCQIGGQIKIFNLNKKYFYKKGQLQDNLINFYNEYGSRFKILYMPPKEKHKKKSDKIEIIIKLFKVKLIGGAKYYRMIHDIPHRTTNLVPLQIDFIDNQTIELNNNSYIANIHKTYEISGTNLIKICLKINEILGAEKTRLYDGTSVNCDNVNMDLSYLKLLEKGVTFYMGLGFDFEVTHSEWFHIRYSNKNILKKEVSKLIKELRLIKIADIINEYRKLLKLINLVVIENNEQNLQIIIKDLDIVKSASKEHDLNSQQYKTNAYYFIPELYKECFEMLDILNNNTNYTYLYELMIDLFKDKTKCNNYTKLFFYLVESLTYKIIYGNHIITKKYGLKFRLLQVLRQNYSYSYTF